MIKDPHGNVFTIGIGGAAGDGVRESGQSLGQLLCELGYEVYISNTFPSLIRGGHNFTRVSFSKEKIWCDHEKLDVLIALNEETLKIHSTNGVVVFADRFDEEDLASMGANAVALPMIESVKALNAPAIMKNSVALGATCYLLDLNYSVMQKILNDVFKGKMPEVNIRLADIGFDFLKKNNFRHPRGLASVALEAPALNTRNIGGQIGAELISRKLLDGNTAVGMGLISAGLDFYVAYPMTPVTGLLHFLAGKHGDIPGLKVIQPESELSVINMALGMSYAGKRSAVGSATGGFMLMQESFSLSGMAELPLAIIVGQRQAPATGVPTVSSQTDLASIIHAGHGEFPRIVLLPGDTEEAFVAGMDALNLAWKYQIPVIVLMDKIICENSVTSLINDNVRNIDHGKTVGKLAMKTSLVNVNNVGIDNSDARYARYKITPDGISPIAFPGTPGATIKVSSYEHDEAGVTTDDAQPVKMMIDKRAKKAEMILNEFLERETVKVCGDRDGKNVIVFWGSTKGAVLEASKYLRAPAKLVQIIWAEPFDVKKVTKELTGANMIINIECNHNAQMASLIREKTGIKITDNILKYDSRPLDPIELAGEINSKLFRNICP